MFLVQQVGRRPRHRALSSLASAHRLDVWERARDEAAAGSGETREICVSVDGVSLRVAAGSLAATPLSLRKAALSPSASPSASPSGSVLSPRNTASPPSASASKANAHAANTPGSKDLLVALLAPNNTPFDLTRPLEHDAQLHFGTAAIWADLEDPLSIRDKVADSYWHSSAHLLGWALEEHFGDDILLDDGPPVPMQGRVGGGYFYDSLLVKNGKHLVKKQLDAWSNNKQLLFTPSTSHNTLSTLLENPNNIYHATNTDLESIQKLMNSLSSTKSRFERLVVSRATALDLFAYNPLKLALLAKIPETAEITLYKCGDFIDLCRGPHIPHVGLLSASKILRTASATLSPSLLSTSTPSATTATSPLTRIYGITFPRPAQLTQWTATQLEAQQRDHRLIGKQQSLFLMHPMSPGSAFMLPHGTRIANRLMEFVRKEYRREGYHEVVTPLVFNKELWVTSGHWQNYREDMFLVTGGGDGAEKAGDEHSGAGGCGHSHGDEAEDSHDQHGLKPMNCPGHCLVFANKSYSYRELPVRLAEFSPLHRNESSGSLSGLTRVRKFHQDDAHIFCTPAQIQSEISSTLALIHRIYTALQFPSYTLALSTRPEKAMGTPEQWEKAETALRTALTASGRPYTLKPGDGAFYGPKIDVMVQDAMGRTHQTATIQLDFQLPTRFGLHYVAEDGTHHTPVMIHRAALGSVERMMGILMEHYGGRWPFWVSPRQAVVIPAVVDEEVVEYAVAVGKALAVGGGGWNSGVVRDRIRGGVKGDEVYSATMAPSGGEQFFHVDARVHDVDQTLGKRVRDAWVARYNFVVVVGRKELENGTVSVRMNSAEGGGGEGSGAGKKDQNLGEMSLEKVPGSMAPIESAPQADHAVDEELMMGNEPSGSLQCPTCQQVFTYAKALTNHIESHGRFACPAENCSFRTSHARDLTVHVRTHTGEKPYSCLTCNNYSSASLSNLKSHQRRHAAKPPLKCGQCDFVAANQKDLKFHERVHSASHKFRCNLCDFCTTKPGPLANHIKGHTKEPQGNRFQCSQCEYSTSIACNLKRHQKNHDGEGSFKCLRCSFSTKQISTMRTHEKIHAPPPAVKLEM
ncbi:54S ribosomal protein L39, mitochondrial [Podochytrium sp. JEL0797]|nr:54S ribosomal protein L39, mitochondrial [Podochytrium sp. JEL0797]